MAGGEVTGAAVRPDPPDPDDYGLVVRVVGGVVVVGPIAVTQDPASNPWIVAGTVTANQGTPNIDANSWPVHQVGPLPTGANVIGFAGIDPANNDVDVLTLPPVTQGGPWVVDQSPLSNPWVIRDTTTGTLNNGVETAVAAVAVQIIAANAVRHGLIIQNVGGANIRVGAAGVAANTGFRLTPGQAVTLSPPYQVTNAVFAIREGLISSTAFATEIT